MEKQSGKNIMTLSEAVGTIEAGADQQERLSEICERLSNGEFYTETTDRIPSMCIDGRSGASNVRPNTAGGSESIMVAEDLTSRRFAAADEPTAVAYDTTLAYLLERGFPVGGHTDDHAADAKSGCGANDRLPEIYGFIAEHGDGLRALAESIGVPVADRTHELIVDRARTRSAFSSGAELLDDLIEKAGEASAPVLHGAHKEVAAVINLVDGTTLDRAALAGEFGPDYQAFNVDAWSFKDTASVVSPEGTGLPSLVAALTYYNLATAHVLCGPGMRVIVRR